MFVPLFAKDYEEVQVVLTGDALTLKIGGGANNDQEPLALWEQINVYTNQKPH